MYFIYHTHSQTFLGFLKTEFLIVTLYIDKAHQYPQHLLSWLYAEKPK